MNHHVTLTDEEVDEIDHMLQDEIRTTRVELRRTRQPDYRRRVRHHLHVVEGLQQRMHHAAREGAGYGSYL